MQHIPASFYRGGTSRGLVFRAGDLANISPTARSKVLLQSMGSPDPNGRQIDGLGGGVSSLSKVCIVGLPGEGADGARINGSFHGVDWADDVERAKGDKGWDIVYRFCQVGVKNTTLDWSSTCGNMLAAVAHSAFNWGIIHPTRFDASVSLQSLRILSANTGDIYTCRVPVEQKSGRVYIPRYSAEDKPWTTAIAGVPGIGTVIDCWTPLKDGGLGSDQVKRTRSNCSYSIVDAGLANIFLDWQEIARRTNLFPDPPPPLQSLLPSELDSIGGLHTFLETLREEICKESRVPLSSTAPKIVLLDRPVSSIPTVFTDSTTLDSTSHPSLIVRAISVGNFHRTVPGTTIANLVLSQKYKHSVPSRISSCTGKGDQMVLAHPAGIVQAKMETDEYGIPHIVIQRTAREIMRGSVLVSLSEV